MSIRQPVITYIYDRYHYASAKRDAVIMMRIAYRRKSKFLSVGIRVYPKNWDDKNKRVINRVDAVIINQTLDKLLNDVRKVIYEMLEEGHVDIFAIPARLEAKKKVDIAFIDYCEQRAKVREYGKTADSQERYERFLRFLRSWGKIKTFYDLTESRVMELDRYLQTKNMKANSRWNNYHRFLNSFISDARKEGLLQLNPYDRVRIDRGNTKEGIKRRLTPSEFQKVVDVQLPNEKLERVRDLFVFQTYTCLSYTDLRAFEARKIQDAKGRKVYLGKRGKTKEQFIVPLLSPALAVLEKYNGKLPVISNVKYNAYIKEVVTAAGITKPVSTHWARHTGATLLLNAGVSLKVVQKILGHATSVMTEQHYADLLDETVIKAMEEYDNKIKLV